mmetsp:Transcript_25684/g.59359  ORF Transcript_25684/g.59359 Transcript_25684/m.59359 type:complete len:313 (-) Transcript_25684:45-983(-)
MTSALAAVVTLLAARFICVAEGVVRGEPQIKPELSPASHKKFFKMDYPDDESPKQPHSFEHPYPVVQAPKDYDKDFVKDENSDKGEWAAQQNYDRLVNKVREDEEKVQKAKGVGTEKEKTWKKIQEKEEAAQKEEEAKKQAEEERKKAEEERTGKVAEEENRKSEKDNEVMKSVEDGTKKVTEEVKSLEECEEELRKAKAELEELMKEAKGDEKTEAEAEKEWEVARKAQKAAEAYAKKKEAEEAEEAKEHEEAYTSYQEKEKAVEKMEADMHQAEATLRRIRGEETEHSASGRVLPAATLLAALFAVKVLQ